MESGSSVAVWPSSPEMAVVRSCVMAPSHSFGVEILNDEFWLARSVMTSERAKGNSVSPTERKRWPKA